ncbi:MAG TPA: hypothetical protein VGG38_17810 [Acidimicrobiales bacterium]
MADAVRFKESWWQRVRRHWRERKVHVVGSRPGVGRHGVARPGWLTSWITRILAVIVVLFLIALFVGPFKKSLRGDLTNWTHNVGAFVHPTYNPVHPIGAVASSAAPDHAAALAIDGESNTSWETNSGASCVGQTLTMKLAQRENIAKMGFLNGDQDNSNSYLTDARLELVHVAFNGSPTTSEDLNLADTSSFQSFGAKSIKTTSIVLTITSIYPSAVGHTCALAEVEFFTKS